MDGVPGTHLPAIGSTKESKSAGSPSLSCIKITQDVV